MSNAAAQAHAFYRQVATEQKVWTVRDAAGFPAPPNPSGIRCQPFWSSLSRVQKIINSVPAYGGFSPHEIDWISFRDKWLPGLKKDGILIGVNWSGSRAMGYDVDPDSVRIAVEAQMSSR